MKRDDEKDGVRLDRELSKFEEKELRDLFLRSLANEKERLHEEFLDLNKNELLII